MKTYIKSFTPYWKLQNGKWVTDENSWTWNSEVSEFDPQGAELENKDALNRFSSAQFSYGEKLATAVAANSKYRNMGFDNFEDYNYLNCNNTHFSFKKADYYETGTTIKQPQQITTNGVSHTGKKAIIVGPNKEVVLKKNIEDCNNCGTLAVSLPSSLPSVTTVNSINVYVIQASASGGSGTNTYTYEWKVEGGNIIGNDYGSNTVVIEKRTGAFRVIVIVRDNNGCEVTNQYSYKVVN